VLCIWVEKVKSDLGFKARGRKIIGSDDVFELREGQAPYRSHGRQHFSNTFLWN